MKSHTGMGKRVKVTGKGKIVAQQAGLRHNLEKKSSTRTRRLSGTVEVAKADFKRIKKLLGR
ncbi:large subunit ribosomal protein L35 [Plantactinospora soyae]|uniref:Large ribosomal subunit protein bL35 n=2 Tax=Plantactinospora soyae TaxID=1544732 RepID=A0A927R8R3_9ACTN|nr:large subunit ribosomal protein L35 [Plantactinospora soyae]